jgi:hypothetical protein
MLLSLATVLGLTGCSYVRDPAVSERHALPRPRRYQNHAPFSLGLHLMLTRLGSYRRQTAKAGTGEGIGRTVQPSYQVPSTIRR